MFVYISMWQQRWVRNQIWNVCACSSPQKINAAAVLCPQESSRIDSDDTSCKLPYLNSVAVSLEHVKCLKFRRDGPWYELSEAWIKMMTARSLRFSLRVNWEVKIEPPTVKSKTAHSSNQYLSRISKQWILHKNQTLNEKLI